MLCTKHLLYLNISHLWARQGPQTKAQLHISIYVWPPNQFLKIDFAHNILYMDNSWCPYRGCCVQSQFSETDLEAKHKWIYAIVPLTVGPVGPGGGIYSSTEDVLCRVNFRKMIWRPNNRGYMQFCFCLWALSGLVVGYIQL